MTTTLTPPPAPQQPASAASNIARSAQLDKLIPRLITAVVTSSEPVTARRLIEVSADVELMAGTEYASAARQQLITGAAVYLRFFGPPTDGVLHEEGLDADDQAPLVWATPNGIVIDLIDLAAVEPGDVRAVCDTAATKLLERAAGVYGSGVDRIRILTLAAPRRAMTLMSDGSRHLMFGEDSR